MRKAFVFHALVLFSVVNIQRITLGQQQRATTPPRGWNSYDSFCWTVSEEEFLQNAELVSHRLRAHGYEYVVVDYLWYRRKVPGAYVDSLGFDVIDKWGRMMPDPGRWPSSKGGKGFTEVAKKVHGMGLKFGIHVMRGISTQAFNANTPILDTTKGRPYEENGHLWRARDIGIKERSCAWMSHGFMSVDTKSGAGRAFLRSLYEQYAEWGVDFVKHDCVFGNDLDIGEISFVSEVLSKLRYPIIYSLSPGTSVTPTMAKQVSALVNMYRITGDDWDTWADVKAHFGVTRDFAAAKMIGSGGLLGKSWPDLDMLPLGWLTDPGSNQGPHRQCKLNLNEQRTQMALWAMAKSPLMFGGDLRKLEESTYNIITNPLLLEINAYSSNNKEFPVVGAKHSLVCDQQLLGLKSGYIRNVHLSHAHFMGLVSCMDGTAMGWSVEALDDDHDQVCWKENSGSYQPQFCLYKRKSQFALDEYEGYNSHYQGKSSLLVSTENSICLDASPREKLTSKELKRGSLSPCKSDANQMWEVDVNGTLISSYSGLCATMKTAKDAVVPGGVRSWVATGRKGEVYIAFFNLNEETTVILAKMSDLEKALPGYKFDAASCRCTELWSGQDCGISADLSISLAVEVHGSALFILNCRPG